MDHLADDDVHASPRSGLLLAGVSAVCFGLSGPLAGGLLEQGWSAGAVVLVRLGLAALVLAPWAVRSLGGQFRVLLRRAGLVALYGAVAIGGTQYAYFSAVARMDVAPTLLIEYSAPVVVLLWQWLRRGEKPSVLTLAGAALAVSGLLLVIGIGRGVSLPVGGVLWAVGAMVGVSIYFVLSARSDLGLPPQVLACSGLGVGALVVGGLGAAGALPLTLSTGPSTYADVRVPWWLPLIVLGVVTAALAYAAGIAAGRRLGARVAAFVALLEVVAAAVAAWLLLGQVPEIRQMAGGALILAGVVAVKLGDRPSGTVAVGTPAAA